MVTTTKQLHNPCGGNLCLDFVNSIGRTPGRTGNERLADFPALTLWSVQAGSLPERAARALNRLAAARPRAAERALGRARALREALFAVFRAGVHGRRPPPNELERLNAELAAALAQTRVERAGEGFRWTWSGASASLEAPLWPIARAAAELLLSPERELIKECASERCLWLFVDRTRNHGRRWCEMKGCGNRAKVRELRRRRRESGAE